MASTINATTSGVVTTGDSVATLSLQTGGTTAVAIDSAQIVSLSKSLALLGSTSGSVALAAPATAGTQSYTLPTAQPTADGLALTSTKVGAMSWAAPTATAAGSDTQVQYNSGGTAFGAASTFTFNNSTGVVTATGFSGAVNGTVGATTPSTGSFTTLAASSTVSGTGFSTYLASPPAIGGTAPAAGTFTTAKAIAASTQDAVQLQGRAGGTSSYVATITPTTLTASRTITLPNADINFATGLPVANGGTGLTSGTSGGVPYFSGASARSSSAALTQYGIVYGGGAGAAPVATAVGTTGQFLGANTGGAPTWQTPSGGSSGPTFFAYLSSNQTPITNGTITKVTLNATSWDTASAFNTSTNRFTPQTAGYYWIGISADMLFSTTFTKYFIAIYKNGTQLQRIQNFGITGSQAGSTTLNFDEMIPSGGTIVNFNGSTDYVELYVYMIGTGTGTVYSGSQYTWMSGAFIRA